MNHMFGNNKELAKVGGDAQARSCQKARTLWFLSGFLEIVHIFEDNYYSSVNTPPKSDNS